MIAIIDYDAGNIKSVEKALGYLGQESVLTRDPQVILHADKAILPGVGSFGDAMGRLHDSHLDQVIRDFTAAGKPFLGICGLRTATNHPACRVSASSGGTSAAYRRRKASRYRIWDGTA